MGISVGIIVECRNRIAGTEHKLKVIVSVLVVDPEGPDHILVCINSIVRCAVISSGIVVGTGFILHIFRKF